MSTTVGPVDEAGIFAGEVGELRREVAYLRTALAQIRDFPNPSWPTAGTWLDSLNHVRETAREALAKTP
jgi:hypothetical protein